ncbi:MAG TPA: phage tail protein I [Pseudonocardiaceae bacterium]|jgi:phage tail-like protein
MVNEPLGAVVEAMFAPLRQVVQEPEVYVDPVRAPEPMLRWLAALLGGDDALPPDQRRRQLADAMAAHRRRGTVAGLTALIRLYGGTADITEGHDPQPWVRVVVTLADENLADALRDAVLISVPAHVRCEVDFVATP